MNLQHIAFKIFVDGELTTDWEQFINIFHTWVAEQSMSEMMIDVADYRHVPNGPGVVMVGHEADYFLDNSSGQPGLRYVCKIEREGSNADRIRQAVASATVACAGLQDEVSGLKFSRTNFELTINDRGLAPNNQQTRAALSSEISPIIEDLLGSAQIEMQQDPRKLAGAIITTAAPVDLASLRVN